MSIAASSIQSANDDKIVEFSFTSQSSNVQKKVYKSVFIIINFNVKDFSPSSNEALESEDNEKKFDENKFIVSSRQIRLKDLIRQKKRPYDAKQKKT